MKGVIGGWFEFLAEGTTYANAFVGRECHEFKDMNKDKSMHIT